MDSLNDMTKPEKLREVIQNQAYILAITAEKNRNMEMELKDAKAQANQLQAQTNELHVKTSQMESASSQLASSLNVVKSKLYDIEFDTYWR